MKKLGVTIAAAGAVAATLVASSALAGTAAATKLVPFTASYAGTAVVKVTGSRADISANGTGRGTLLPGSKITGKGIGDTSAQPCVPFNGPGKMTAGTTTLAFNVISGSTACGEESGQVFSISGRIKVTRGTGKLAGARGTLKFTGIYDRGKGTFSVKFRGNLTV